MNPVASLSQASYTALKGLDRAIASVENTAEQVASHPAELTYGPQFEAFIQLQNARVQASSNIAVLRTINSLYHELSRLPPL